jgi:hypothetical protein
MSYAPAVCREFFDLLGAEGRHLYYGTIGKRFRIGEHVFEAQYASTQGFDHNGNSVPSTQLHAIELVDQDAETIVGFPDFPVGIVFITANFGGDTFEGYRIEDALVRHTWAAFGHGKRWKSDVTDVVSHSTALRADQPWERRDNGDTFSETEYEWAFEEIDPSLTKKAKAEAARKEREDKWARQRKAQEEREAKRAAEDRRQREEEARMKIKAEEDARIAREEQDAAEQLAALEQDVIVANNPAWGMF